MRRRAGGRASRGKGVWGPRVPPPSRAHRETRAHRDSNEGDVRQGAPAPKVRGGRWGAEPARSRERDDKNDAVIAV